MHGTPAAILSQTGSTTLTVTTPPLGERADEGRALARLTDLGWGGVLRTLFEAERRGYRTITFPALGTGVGGVPHGLGNAILLPYVLDFLKDAPLAEQEVRPRQHQREKVESEDLHHADVTPVAQRFDFAHQTAFCRDAPSDDVLTTTADCHANAVPLRLSESMASGATSTSRTRLCVPATSKSSRKEKKCW